MTRRNYSISKYPGTLYAALARVVDEKLVEGRGGWILPAVAVLMAGVGLLAALGPARQWLRIQPTEALRDE